MLAPVTRPCSEARDGGDHRAFMFADRARRPVGCRRADEQMLTDAMHDGEPTLRRTGDRAVEKAIRPSTRSPGDAPRWRPECPQLELATRLLLR
jgi:hypothetical protein